jgi:predicted RND superfamily exporter protein
MISRIYRAYSRPLLWLIALSFPWLYWQSHAVRSNNDIETWLPKNTEVRQNYERFKEEFGIEEVVVLGIEQGAIDEVLTESLAARFDGLPGVRECITPTRLIHRMQDLGVPEGEARKRLTGLLLGRSGNLAGLIIGLDEFGAAHRSETVARIRESLDYCLLERPEICLTGSPVLVTELDRLGSPEATTAFFGLTLLICLGLLKYSIGDWRMSLTLLGVTVWTICLTKVTVLFCGGEMNFIMGALSVMVMIFTLTIAVHFIDYFTEAREAGHPDPLWFAMRESWGPCVLSTLTTLLGLVSLNVSSILPVRQFGYAAALGAVIAMIIGLGVTPALVTIWPNRTIAGERTWFDFARWGAWVGRRRWPMLGAAAVLTVAAGFGLLRLEPHISPVEFLPVNNPVALDLRRVDRELTSIGSVEAIVDLGLEERPFIEKMLEVRRIQTMIAGHPAVRHAFSVASLFPDQLPDNPLTAAELFGKALQQGGGSGYLAQNERLWRISIRIDSGWQANDACNGLRELLAGEPVLLTGVSPLIADAQHEIFQGYWQSLTAALITISLVMIVSLRSLVAGLVAMVPNILPIWFVFGIVGYIGLPVDIGMMMTGSIAIGISVDCTFHYLTKYQQSMKRGRTSLESSCDALAHTGKPLMESTVVSSVGMLALCLSSFTPTSRFGWLMASMMVTSLLGELILLPALLSLRPAAKAKAGRKPAVGSTPLAAAAIDGPGRIEAPHGVPARRPHLPDLKTGAVRNRRGLDI